LSCKKRKKQPWCICGELWDTEKRLVFQITNVTLFPLSQNILSPSLLLSLSQRLLRRLHMKHRIHRRRPGHTILLVQPLKRMHAHLRRPISLPRGYINLLCLPTLSSIRDHLLQDPPVRHFNLFRDQLKTMRLCCKPWRLVSLTSLSSEQQVQPS
jgi:hypothetical protein